MSRYCNNLTTLVEIRILLQMDFGNIMLWIQEKTPFWAR